VTDGGDVVASFVEVLASTVDPTDATAAADASTAATLTG
jgi:hypothetical protein